MIRFSEIDPYSKHLCAMDSSGRGQGGGCGLCILGPPLKLLKWNSPQPFEPLIFIRYNRILKMRTFLFALHFCQTGFYTRYNGLGQTLLSPKALDSPTFGQCPLLHSRASILKPALVCRFSFPRYVSVGIKLFAVRHISVVQNLFINICH